MREAARLPFSRPLWELVELRCIVQIRTGRALCVQEGGVEPPRVLSPPDFESGASAYSATPACCHWHCQMFGVAVGTFRSSVSGSTVLRKRAAMIRPQPPRMQQKNCKHPTILPNRCFLRRFHHYSLRCPLPLRMLQLLLQ